MQRFFLLTVLFCMTNIKADAQIIDSLPYFKLPERIGAFAELVGPLTNQQQHQISSTMLEMADRNRFGQTSAPLRQQRQRLGRTIIGFLNDSQKVRLRSQTEGGENPIRALLRDFPPKGRG